MRNTNSWISSKGCGNYWKSLVPIVFLLAVVYGQSYAQWHRTSLGDSIGVNIIKMEGSFIAVGTNGYGIFVSTDEGESWTSRNTGLQDNIVHALLIVGNRLFAGTETGVSVSVDNGENWRTINSGLAALGIWSLEAGADGGGDTTIFAGAWSGVYTSTDGGENWRVTGLSSTTMPVHSLVIVGDHVFAGTYGEGIFRSQDNGLTWKNISITPQDVSAPIDLSVPVCFIANFVGTHLGARFDYIVAGSSFGDCYYMDYRDAGFQGAFAPAKQSAALLCCAQRNDTMFAANAFGNFYRTYYSNGRLNCDRSSIPYLGGGSTYSLAMNGAYVFAGTEDGVWRLSYPESITGVGISQDGPDGFILKQNYPNPFNLSTTLQYALPTRSHVRILVYNTLGQIVAELLNEEQPEGRNQVVWNANVVSGLYVYRFEAISVNNPGKRFVDAKKMILLK